MLHQTMAINKLIARAITDMPIGSTLNRISEDRWEIRHGTVGKIGPLWEIVVWIAHQKESAEAKAAS